MGYEHCKLCPRECGVDRTRGEIGFCGGSDLATVAKTMLHRWEEPALAGNGGSGTIFVGGCNLGCIYRPTNSNLGFLCCCLVAKSRLTLL